MTLRTAEAWPGTIPWRACLPYLVAAFIYVVILISGQSLLNDPDSYWHVAVGQWIVAHGAVPVADPFSFTFAGQHWIAKEWLSQLLYSGASALADWPGMVVLAAAAAALAFALLARWLERELAPLASLVLVAATFVLAAPHLTARPHVLAWPVIVVWVGGLVRAVDRRQAPSLWLLAAMVLWANLHGSFTLGILLAGAAGLDAILSAPRDDRLRTAFVWFRFGILTVAAASITPYGPESMLVTGRILGLGGALSVIGEWRPVDFGQLGTFEIVLFLAAALVLSRGFKLSPGRIIALLGILHLALAHERNTDFLGLIAPIFLAAPIARQFPGLGRMPAEPLSPAGRMIAAAAIAALVPISWAIAFVADFRPAERITPAAAVAALRAVTTGPIMNSYDFGGYLIANGIPTFIDGRTELYGGPFTLRYQNAVTLADLNDFIALLDKYKIGATLFWPGTPANAFLDRLPGWRRLYADDVAVVHIRDPKL